MSMMIRRHKAKREPSVVPAPKEVTAYSGGEKSLPETPKADESQIGDSVIQQEKPKRGRPSRK